MTDYSCAKFGDFISAVLFLSCGQTDRQTDRITEVDQRYTHETTIGVGNAVRICRAEIK